MVHIQTAERIRWMERAHELPTFERYPPQVSPVDVCRRITLR
jgi:hypothetical protein